MNIIEIPSAYGEPSLYVTPPATLTDEQAMQTIETKAAYLQVKQPDDFDLDVLATELISIGFEKVIVSIMPNEY